jgi:predicted DNA-binding protein (MmcQ/YjbR family)
MDIETYRTYCLSFTAVEEGFPFDQKVLVFKVAGKIFALTDVDNFESVNLKCDPEEAIALREQYSAVTPGYHMNKAHWNTVRIDGSVSDAAIRQWTKNSYDLVAASLTKKQREAYGLV